MPAYVSSMGLLSPQPTNSYAEFVNNIKSYNSFSLTCIEPEYRELIPPIHLRRMSRILKLGLGSAIMCLKNATGTPNPNAIIIGTGLGCLENLDKYLVSVIEENEQTLSPIPFINSTTNMVGSQIATMLKNHSYNLSYSHKGLSFETALLDALLLIEEEKAQQVLTGAIDESTPNNILLHKHIGYWKEGTSDSLGIFNQKSKGTISGEGAFFSLLTSQQQPETLATLAGITTYTGKLSGEALQEQTIRFLQENNLQAGDIDLFLTGMNGDAESDNAYQALYQALFTQASMGAFKHLCGEYCTASAFGFWLACNLLKYQEIPEQVLLKKSDKKEISNVLLYNCYNNNQHSFILLKR